MEFLNKINECLENNILNIIFSALFGMFLTYLFKYFKQKIFTKEFANRISRIKLFGAINYFFKFIFPTLIIVYILLSNNLAITPINILSLIVLVCGLFFQVVMSHIDRLYLLYIEKIHKDTQIVKDINETFNKVYYHIENK